MGLNTLIFLNQITPFAFESLHLSAHSLECTASFRSKKYDDYEVYNEYK
jgi:hypothetical protein